MNLRPFGTYVLGMTAVVATASWSEAKVIPSAPSNSASHVAAEVAEGKLSPADSKPGDTFVVRLKQDVKANGAVVLKKGTTITGLVRNVKAGGATKKALPESKGQVQSMMEIEWLVPALEGKVARTISIALQSVMQVNETVQKVQHNELPAPASTLARAMSTSSAVVSMQPRTPSPVLQVTNTSLNGASASTRSRGKTNPALLSMPSVVAADQETSSTIESNLGPSSSGQLFKVGRGRVVTAGGIEQSVNLFSHLNNDTVITSSTKGFEISSGAQMQLLVGVSKN